MGIRLQDAHETDLAWPPFCSCSVEPARTTRTIARKPMVIAVRHYPAGEADEAAGKGKGAADYQAMAPTPAVVRRS